MKCLHVFFHYVTACVPAFLGCSCQTSGDFMTTFCTDSHLTDIPHLFINDYITDVLVLWGNDINHISHLPKASVLDLRFQNTVNCKPLPPELSHHTLQILGLCENTTNYPSNATHTSNHSKDSLPTHQTNTTELSTVNLPDFTENTISNRTFQPSLQPSTTNVSYVTTSIVIQSSKNISLKYTIIFVIITFLVTTCTGGVLFFLYRKCKNKREGSWKK